MRIAISSLILAAGIATAAQAQDPAAQPAQPAAPAPEAAQPATPAPPAPAPAAEAPAPAPAEPAAPPPTLSTSGYGFEATQIIEKICVPAVRGQKVEDVAKANGFKLNRRDQTWAKPFGTENKIYQV